jgi:hypothetical protein
MSDPDARALSEIASFQLNRLNDLVKSLHTHQGIKFEAVLHALLERLQ